ncbi:MAG: hypothetical protein M3044_08910 [Thermoproteota archaeon]|nr:hypothetical protein [Thermoproteota archaeon]
MTVTIVAGNTTDSKMICSFHSSRNKMMFVYQLMFRLYSIALNNGAFMTHTTPDRFDLFHELTITKFDRLILLCKSFDYSSPV